MPPPKRSFTKNPVKPARYRPGKAVAEVESSDEESEISSEADEKNSEQHTTAGQKSNGVTSKPHATSVKLKDVDFAQRRHQAESQESERKRREHAERERIEREAGFVTASESESEGSDGSDEEEEDESDAAGRELEHRPQRNAAAADADLLPSKDRQSESSEESSSEEEESESSEDDRPKIFRPTFSRKTERTTQANDYDDAQRLAEEAARKQQRTDELVQETIEQRQAERAAGNRDWDDDADVENEDAIDDTDGLDPELEHQQWVARELMRLRRSRLALEEREREIAEVERRRQMSSAERDAEDREHVARQQQEKQSRAKVQHLQKYQHKGAFYQGDAEELGLRNRDLMGAHYEDQIGAKDTLPEYLQVRDVTRIGRKGRTRYKDLKSEDTGRFATDMGSKRSDRYAMGDDERFRPDHGPPNAVMDATGANASMLGSKRRPVDDVSADKVKRSRGEG